MAAARRRISSWERGPGMGVRNSITDMSVPSNRLFAEVDVDLLCFEILLDTPGPQLATEAGLFVAAPGGFDIGRLHVVHLDDAGAEGLDDAESAEDVARPDGGGKAIRRGVVNANCFRLIGERDDCRDRAENVFMGEASGVIHVIENRGLDIIATRLGGRTAAA